MRLAMALLAAVLLLSPAAAGQSDAGGSRFEIVPGATGVTRLDTETGIISYCTQQAGTWYCESADGTGGLSETLAALTARIEALEGRLDRLAPDSATAKTKEAGAGPKGAAAVVDRFLELVRRLKHRTSNEVTLPSS